MRASRRGWVRLVCLMVLSCALARADDLAENQLRFGQVEGDVQVLAQGSATWLDAHVDLPLEVGDTVRVGEESTAELSAAKTVLWTLQPNSEVIVGHTTQRDGRLTLSYGVLLGKADAIGAGPWEFETPMGIYLVRGAEFALTQSDEEGTHLGVFKGQVELQQAETATQTFPIVLISAREEGVLQKKKPFKKITVFSSLIKAQAQRFPAFLKRFRAISAIWVPMTADYRRELRRKFIPAVRPHPVRRKASTSKRKAVSAP